MIYLVLLLALIVAGLFVYANLTKQQYLRFQRFAKEGDPCKFLLNGKKQKGTLYNYHPTYFYSYVKDENGVHRVFTDDIYPIFNYNYGNA